jgi:uncharacterized protein YhbP (UPF0306 family)
MAVVDNGVCTRYEGHIFMNEMTYVFDILNTNLYKYMGKTRLLQVLYNNSINIVSCVNLF